MFLAALVPAAISAIGGAGAAAGGLSLGGAAAAAAAGGTTAAGLAGTATTLTSLGTLASTVGAVGSGVAGALNANYQGQVARNNAAIESQNAAAATRAGQSAESNKRIETGLDVGRMAAAQGANDVDVGFGTTAKSRISRQTLGNLDALTIRYNAAREAYGYGVSARGYKAQSQADQAQAGESVLSGVLGGAKSFIGGAQALVGQQLGFQQQGVPGY